MIYHIAFQSSIFDTYFAGRQRVKSIPHMVHIYKQDERTANSCKVSMLDISQNRIHYFQFFLYIKVGVISLACTEFHRLWLIFKLMKLENGVLSSSRDTSHESSPHFPLFNFLLKRQKLQIKFF